MREEARPVARTSSVRRPASARAGPLGWLSRLTLHDRLVLVVALVALALRLWPLGGASTDYDEGVYWQSLRAMAAGHPLFSQVFSSQPPLFLIGLYPFYLVLGQSLVAARLAVVLYSLAGLAAMYFAGRAVAGRWAGLAACALLAVDPLYLRVSHTLQAEAPALAFQIACVALAAAANRLAGSDRRRRMLAAASGAALGMGIMVKLFDVVALLPALLYLAMPLYAAFAGRDGRIRRPERDALLARTRLIVPDVGLFFIGTLAALLVVLLPFAGRWGALYDQVVRFHLAAASSTSQGLGYNIALIWNNALSMVLVAVFVVGSLLALGRPSAKILPPLVWLLASLVLLLRQQPLFDHHVALLIPPLVLLTGIVVGDVLNARGGYPHAWPREVLRHEHTGLRVFAMVGFVSLLLLIASVSRNLSAARPISDDQRLISTALERLTVPGDVVVSDDQYVAGLADRDVVPQLVDTSEVRITTGDLTTRQIEAIITQSDARMVLFASGRFDRLPGFRAWVRANFTEVGTFGGGRALYMKQPSAPVPV
jgi:hypothetical protein